MSKLVMYSNPSETIVTTLENEHEMIRQYFDEGGRDKDDYDREVAVDDTGIVIMSSNVCVSME